MKLRFLNFTELQSNLRTLIFAIMYSLNYAVCRILRDEKPKQLSLAEEQGERSLSAHEKNRISSTINQTIYGTVWHLPSLQISLSASVSCHMQIHFRPPLHAKNKLKRNWFRTRFKYWIFNVGLQKGRVSQRFVAKHRNCMTGYARIS